MAAIAARGSVTAADMLRNKCEEVVTAEVARLSQRVPGLSAPQLRQVEATIARVVQDLVLSRARTVRDGQLATLFGLSEPVADSRSGK